MDLPDAPRPHLDTPAAVRFLPEYDNATLSYADRSRVVPPSDHVPLQGGPGGWVGSELVDGRVQAMWAARPGKAATVLTVRPSLPLPAAARADVEAEGGRLLRWLAPGRDHDVRWDDR